MICVGASFCLGLIGQSFLDDAPQRVDIKFDLSLRFLLIDDFDGSTIV